jgi:hypothetical protein
MYQEVTSMRKWPASVDKSAGTFILDFLAQQI